MRKRINIPGQKYNKYAVLQYQKHHIERNFKFLKCKIKNKVLVCTGVLKPNDCANSYEIKIEYVAGHEPKTTIISPVIKPSVHIHMYDDHSICLHYSPDMIWNEKIPVWQFTIPWISEWIIFYELYLINSKWEGKESPYHITDGDKNINKNIE